MTKNELLYAIHAVATDESIEKLPELARDNCRKLRDAYRAGKRVRTSFEDLQTVLDGLAGSIGQDNATAMIASQKIQDEITRADPKDVDYVAKFGKEPVRHWLNDRTIKTPKKLSTKKLNERVSTEKLENWQDEPEAEVAAKRQAALDKVNTEKERKAAEEKAKADAAAAPTTRPSTRKSLTITAPIRIEVSKKDKVYTGLLNTDATVTFDAKEFNGDVAGKTFKSPSKAACAALKVTAVNGWLRVTFMKGEVKTPIDALRENPKGYTVSTGGGRRRKVVGTPQEVERLEARVRRLTSSLEKATAGLAAARQALAEAGGDASSDQAPALPEAPAGEFRAARKLHLETKKAKDLRAIAKGLGMKGYSKLKTADLVQAILDKEFNTAEAA